MIGTYRFAEWNVQIDSLHQEVQDYCVAYKTDAAPDFCVKTTEEEIRRERELSAEENAREGISVIEYSDGYLEELAVYRRIAERMPSMDTILFHGSVIAVDGEAYIFTAKSGTGKSTHTRLWRQHFGDRAVMVNDDKPLIRITGDGAIAYGTPYNGKHRLGAPISAPVKAICILERDRTNHIEPISKSDAFMQLIQQTYRPQDGYTMAKTLQLLDRLASSVKLYRLGCNMDPEAAIVSYQGMQ